jgi:hypothetical protein
MATSYTAKFGSACSPAAPCIFDTDTKNPTGGVSTGIGLPTFRPVTDGTALVGPTAIGGAAMQLLSETSGDPNLP